MLIKISKAQSTLEYVLLLAVVVGSLLYMQNYLKRSMQGRFQKIGDQISDQYSPGVTFRNVSSIATAAQVQELETRGVDSLSTTTTTGGHREQNELRRLEPLEEEKWPQ
ncbi:MAG: hypothetical protein JW867_05495 [Candidatus Omnitrophica bacterium]|nr:hypothetical protein [Candidatus Omnitrophota bacterium]